MNDSQKFVIKYENLAALFAGQTIVNANGSEVIIDFSSGPIPGANEEQILPIHTRIAMSPPAAQRLARLLDQATGGTLTGEQAQLPRV